MKKSEAEGKEVGKNQNRGIRGEMVLIIGWRLEEQGGAQEAVIMERMIKGKEE